VRKLRGFSIFKNYSPKNSNFPQKPIQKPQNKKTPQFPKAPHFALNQSNIQSNKLKITSKLNKIKNSPGVKMKIVHSYENSKK
jgi:hypothetical protein